MKIKKLIVEKFFNEVGIDNVPVSWPEKTKLVTHFFIKEMYNSTPNDDFYKELLDSYHILLKDSNLKNFEENLKNIVDDKKSTYGHIIRYLYVFSGEKDREFNKDITFKVVVNSIYSVLNALNYKLELSDIPKYNQKSNVYDCNISKFFWKIVDIRQKHIDKLRKEERRIKKLSITITIPQLIKLIKISSLDIILKESIIERLKDTDDILEIVEDNAVFCDMDSCLEFYEKNTGRSYIDSKGNEREDVEPFVIKHFKDNLSNFPFNICTEDYIQIYSK